MCIVTFSFCREVVDLDEYCQYGIMFVTEWLCSGVRALDGANGSGARSRLVV